MPTDVREELHRSQPHPRCHPICWRWMSPQGLNCLIISHRNGHHLKCSPRAELEWQCKELTSLPWAWAPQQDTLLKISRVQTSWPFPSNNSSWINFLCPRPPIPDGKYPQVSSSTGCFITLAEIRQHIHHNLSSYQTPVCRSGDFRLTWVFSIDQGYPRWLLSHPEWKKSDRERQILYDITYVRNLKRWNWGLPWWHSG